MEFLTSFLLLITINLGVSEAFTCEEGWLQGPGDLQQYCYNILGAEVDYYPQYMSFYECKQDCNGLGGTYFWNNFTTKWNLRTPGSDKKCNAVFIIFLNFILGLHLYKKGVFLFNHNLFSHK